MIPHHFFTPGSFGSLAGLAAITYVVTNVFRLAFNFDPRWFGLVVAVVATEIGVYLSGSTDISHYLIGVLNGGLIFLIAAGGAVATNALVRTRNAAPRAHHKDPVERPGFFTSWF